MKCTVVPVGKRHEPAQILRCSAGETMHREESTDYLGDLFNASGKSKFNVIKRIAKAYAILAEIKVILTDIPLGHLTKTKTKTPQNMLVF